MLGAAVKLAILRGVLAGNESDPTRLGIADSISGDFTNTSVLRMAESRINITKYEQCVFLTDANRANYTSDDSLFQAVEVDGKPVLQFEGGAIPEFDNSTNSTERETNNLTKSCAVITKIGPDFNDLPVVAYSLTGTIM